MSVFQSNRNKTKNKQIGPNQQAMGFTHSSIEKKSGCNAGDQGSIPGSERSPGEGMATHSSILSWRIP